MEKDNKPFLDKLDDFGKWLTQVGVAVGFIGALLILLALLLAS